ncbi:MAG: FliH/SctL family protein [Arcobacteraceae bacterium]
MQKNNVYSNATIVKGTNEKDQKQEMQSYQLGSFYNDEGSIQSERMQQVASFGEPKPAGYVDPLLAELQALKAQMQNIETKVTNIETNGVSGRDLDKQVIQAIKDLKNYASFFEQATFQLEGKILKTSMAIAKKIIAIEVGENSSLIAKETIKNLLNKVKTASKIQIHLNPKDYLVLKDQLKLDSYVELHEDVNVTAGGVVIASDLGNFDGNIQAKVNSMLDSLESVL